MSGSDQDKAFNPQNHNLNVTDNDNLSLDDSEPVCDFENDTTKQAVFVVRCLTLFFCLVGIIIVLVNICKAKNRLKSWPLYIFVAISTFFWVAMSLYHDKIDAFCSKLFLEDPKINESIYVVDVYWCIRNFLHGFSLYLILVLLAHLSDIKNKCQWIGLIVSLIVVPIIYSVGVFIEKLYENEWIDNYEVQTKDINTGVDSVRILLYNIITTFLLFFMSKR